MAGQGLVEYALILVLIAVVIIVIMALLGTQVNMVFARIMLQIEHPGDYSGESVTVTSISVSTRGSRLGGNLIASATVGLGGASSSPNICVQFSDSQHGSKVDCDPNPSVTFPDDGGSGEISACVLGVEGYSLSGGPYCSSAGY
jgi:pilus assembly protein Flp/PilA